MTLERQIKGLLPALDRRQVPELFVLDGQNFLVDAEGPFSAFGSELVTKERIANPQFADTFRVEGRIFLLTQSAVLELDTTSHLYWPRFTFPSATAEFPWSRAVVGGLHYFCKPGAGVFQYDPTTDHWRALTVNVIANPYAVIESGGRLVILSRFAVQWSGIDEGDNLALDADLGIGSQLLAKAGGGEPLALLRTFDGFIVYTRSGLLKAQLVDSVVTFRFDRLTGDDDDSEFIPLSPYTVIMFGRNTHLILSKSGFFRTSGNVPEPYQPLLGEYFRRQIFRNFDLSVVGVFKLTYNSDRQWLFISLSDLQRAFEFNRAFVIYIPRDEVGVFNRNHAGFGELSFTSGLFKGFNFGYFCLSGCMHRFTDTAQVELHPDEFPGELYFFHELLDMAARRQDSVYFYSTVGHMDTFSTSPFTQGSRIYEFRITQTFISPETLDVNFETPVSGAVTLYRSMAQVQAGQALSAWVAKGTLIGSIDAFIEVGLFQPAVEEVANNDQASLVLNATIGMAERQDGVEFEDWNNVPVLVEEDWNNVSTGVEEDWGSRVVASTEYVAEIIGSIDGYNVFESQQEVLEERDDVVSAGVNTGRSRYFACYNTGIMHIIKLSARNVGESFHLKTIDVPLTNAGRI